MPLPPYQTRSTIPVLVILLGLAASLFTFSVVRHAEDAAEQARFSDRAKQAAARLEDVAGNEVDILARLHDLYRIARPTNDGALRALTHGLFVGDHRDDALAFIGWAVPLDPVQVPAYEHAVREAFPEEPAFEVHGFDGEPAAPPADQRADGYRHWVLEQVAPHVLGGRLHGLDLATDKWAYDAIRECLLSGSLTVS